VDGGGDPGRPGRDVVRSGSGAAPTFHDAQHPDPARYLLLRHGRGIGGNARDGAVRIRALSHLLDRRRRPVRPRGAGGTPGESRWAIEPRLTTSQGDDLVCVTYILMPPRSQQPSEPRALI